MRPLLLVMNPRHIARCLSAIDALDIDKVYLVAHWEAELVQVIADIVDRHDEYTHFLLLADDTVPNQHALDLVLRALADGHPVASAYCNLDATSPHVNITKRPFQIRDRSAWEDYDWYTNEEAATYSGPMIPTHFAGSALTGMSREMWRRFPFDVNNHPGEWRGYSSDWNLCIRLQAASVPIVAPRGAIIEHVKDDWRTMKIRDPEKRLLNGVIPKEIRWSVRSREA